ncbi:MAG: YciI family protein [Actinomycetota bacterium]|nr:YciI family protein [Actinomycetota bacterium]
MLERRAPHREGHLALVEGWAADERLVLAGALGDPPHGALFAFAVDDPAEVEEFVGADPYVEAGLVVSRRMEPLNVVAHRPLD